MSGLIVNDNLSSMRAQENMANNQKALEKSIQRLSSGYRVNSPADDPAGYAISQRMGGQINSYSAATHNIEDGNNLLNTASGALKTENDILLKMRQLAVEASNGTYSEKDLKVLHQEYENLKKEITRISEVTDFNGMKLLNGTHKKFLFQVGIGTEHADRLGVSIGDTSAKALGLQGSSLLNRKEAQNSVKKLDSALDKLSSIQGNVGAIQNRMDWTLKNIETAKTNVSASRAGIRDINFAEATAAYTKQQILARSSSAMLSQANSAPKNVLNLLG